ncbi:MAG: patatin-like phospholipase family protein [Kineosporiaceae bacterium]|nr:patatin-like phospholipase family protein [Kineosporiaceae bacterium]
MGYLDRVHAPGPKKLLALDGGGLRGALTVELLAGLEELLRRRTGAGADFVLADYFDYVAGTSTGAIIAACIAKGMSMHEIGLLYTEHGREMFDRSFLLKRFAHRYDSDRLREMLQLKLGTDTTMGDPALRTLLMMVLRNATTDSPWPLSNTPGARYNQPEHPDCNLRIPLWQLVLASTAAPTYFQPEAIDIGTQQFVFVDGGVTMYNNPAFQLFLMATLPEYGLGWATGEDQLLLVSVGTGTAAKADDRLQPRQMNLLYNAGSVPAALMAAALHQQDTLCRVLGRCRFGPVLDREIGDLIAPPGILESRLMTYVRYCPDLSARGLAALGLSDIRPEDVQRLDSVDHIDDLRRIGTVAARTYLKDEHFKGF